MTLEFGCPGCGRPLRIALEHQGKQIRCPACQQICVAPGTGANAAVSEAAAGADPAATSWHLRTPEGAIYGPISFQDVLGWATEGRVTADCLLAESGQGPWKSATELIPHLPQSTTQAAPPPSGPTTYPWTPASAGMAAASDPPAGGYTAPHRGGLILVLGVMGLVTCAVFGLVAWVMGSHDLREMRAGRMDRSGESATQAGMILGMIVALLWIVCALVASAFALIYIARSL